MQIDMSKYDPFFDNIEEYVNERGATFGDKAEMMEGVAHSIAYLYIHGIATKSQSRDMNKKLMVLVKQYIKIKEV